MHCTTEAPTWNPDSLAAAWDCHRRTVIKLIREGKLPAFKIGTKYKVTDEAKRAFESAQN